MFTLFEYRKKFQFSTSHVMRLNKSNVTNKYNIKVHSVICYVYVRLKRHHRGEQASSGRWCCESQRSSTWLLTSLHCDFEYCAFHLYIIGNFPHEVWRRPPEQRRRSGPVRIGGSGVGNQEPQAAGQIEAGNHSRRQQTSHGWECRPGRCSYDQ